MNSLTHPQTEAKHTDAAFTAHTPAPWFIRESRNGALNGLTIEHEDSTLRSIVARVWDHELCAEHGAMMANARLIAAAPDLVSALQRFSRFMEQAQPGQTFTAADLQGIACDAQQALAKALNA